MHIYVTSNIADMKETDFSARCSARENMKHF